MVAINDPFIGPEHMAYLFRYDSTYGRYPGEVRTLGNCLMVNGSKTTIFLSIFYVFILILGLQIETSQEKDPKKIPWEKNSVDYVIEATGLFTSCEKASV